MDQKASEHTQGSGGAPSYLVEEIQSSDVGFFSLEKLFGDVQQLLSLRGTLRGTDIKVYLEAFKEEGIICVCEGTVC